MTIAPVGARRRGRWFQSERVLLVYRAVRDVAYRHEGPAIQLVLVYLRTAQCGLLSSAHSII